MTTQEVPEPWASRMRQRGFTRGDGQANISSLARAADLAVETVRRAIYGKGVASVETVSALSSVLGDDVEQWLGQTVTLGTYVPPRESALLDPEQREVLDQLIRLMASRNRRATPVMREAVEAADAGSLPKLWAAKRGQSAGRAQRRQQDEDAERQ